MRSLLSHAYHLLLLPIHVILWPSWRPLAATFLSALGARAAGLASGRRAGVAASAAVLVGWMVLALPSVWPLPPVARLSGLALLTAIWAAVAPTAFETAVPAAVGAVFLTAAGWWLCGLPLSVEGLAGSLSVAVGLIAATNLARREIIAATEAGWTVAAGAFALAGGLHAVHAGPHWAVAACVPAVATLATLGIGAAMPALAALTVLAAAAALFASDRGRVVPVDVACLLPLLAWAVTRRLQPRVAPAPACVAAVLVCAALAWGTRLVLWGR